MSETGPKDKGRAANPRAMGQFSAVEEGASTTIVGAQPFRRVRNKVNVPAGVEKVLYLAATDSAFHDKLMQDPDAAVASRFMNSIKTPAPTLRTAGTKAPPVWLMLST